MMRPNGSTLFRSRYHTVVMHVAPGPVVSCVAIEMLRLNVSSLLHLNILERLGRPRPNRSIAIFPVRWSDRSVSMVRNTRIGFELKVAPGWNLTPQNRLLTLEHQQCHIILSLYTSLNDNRYIWQALEVDKLNEGGDNPWQKAPLKSILYTEKSSLLKVFASYATRNPTLRCQNRA